MKKFKVGLQLYSIYEEMEKNMEQALKQVKEIGYDYVEFAGYFGKSADEVRSLLNYYDLKCISVHHAFDDFREHLRENIDFLKTIGAKYYAVPVLEVERLAGFERFETTKKEFSELGAALRDNGIQLLYHNHDFEFGSYEGKFLLDWLFDSVPQEFLQTEIDTCWVEYAGQNPAQYLRKYTGRSPIVHLKDFVCKNCNSASVYAPFNNTKVPTLEENDFAFRTIGKGQQNYAEILSAAEQAESECLIVELELAPNQTVTETQMQSAKISREYLKLFGL